MFPLGMGLRMYPINAPQNSERKISWVDGRANDNYKKEGATGNRTCDPAVIHVCSGVGSSNH